MHRADHAKAHPAEEPRQLHGSFFFRNPYRPSQIVAALHRLNADRQLCSEHWRQVGCLEYDPGPGLDRGGPQCREGLAPDLIRGMRHQGTRAAAPRCSPFEWMLAVMARPPPASGCAIAMIPPETGTVQLGTALALEQHIARVRGNVTPC